MLLVKTSVKQSTIPGAGKGLFADQFISAGTVVWRLDLSTDKVFTETEVAELGDKEKEAFMLHAFQSDVSKNWIACYDNAQYVNHSDTPNLGQVKLDNDTEYSDVALRDIKQGEELLDNYRDYDLDAARKLAN